MPVPAGDDEGRIEDALCALLSARGLVREALLPALLKGVRVRASREQVAAVLRSGAFVESAPGTWQRRTDNDDAPASRVDATVATWSLDELCATLRVGSEDVGAVFEEAARLQPHDRWAALLSQLRSSAREPIPPKVVAHLSTCAAALQARAYEAAETTRRERLTASARRQELRRAKEEARLNDELNRLKKQIEAQEQALAHARERMTAAGQGDRSLQAAVNRLERENSELKASHESLRLLGTTVDRPEDGGGSTPADWHRSPSGVWVLTLSDAHTRGETDLLEELSLLQEGFVIVGAHLTDSRREREVDALVLHPGGVFTIEQKDTRCAGAVAVPHNSPVTVGGVPIEARAKMREQARLQSQMLASIAQRDPPIELGFVQALLAFRGPVSIEVPSVDVLRAGGVVPVLTTDLTQVIESLPRLDELTGTQAADDLCRRLQAPGLPAEALGRPGGTGA